MHKSFFVILCAAMLASAANATAQTAPQGQANVPAAGAPSRSALQLVNLSPDVGIAKQCVLGKPVFRFAAVVQNVSVGADPSPIGVVYAVDDKRTFQGATSIKKMPKNKPQTVPVYVMATKDNANAVPGPHHFTIVAGPNSRTIDFSVPADRRCGG